MNKTLLSKAMFLGAAMAAYQTAQAQVLVLGNNTPDTDTFSNLNAATFGTTGAGVNGLRAAGFTTGGVSLTLDHIDVSLKKGLSGTPTLHASLYTGTHTAPTTFAVDLTVASGTFSGTTPAVFNLQSTGFTLNANTTYWLVIDNDGSGNTISWTQSSASGGSFNTSGGYVYQTGYKSDTEDDLTLGTAVATNPNLAVFTTTAVPEPRAYALLAGLGLCAFAAYRRKVAA